MDKRPKLTNRISIKDFRGFYWLKKELSTFCKKEGLKTTGSKSALSERIVNYLKTGTKEVNPPKEKSSSTFDWQNEKLSLSTIITDNYKNTENVRAFFVKKIGPSFKFNVKFMNWMKANQGSTFKDAIEHWQHLKALSKVDGSKKDIAPQFEYNRYLRDFLAANPNSNRKIGIALWNIKKTKRGDNVYREEDLDLLN